MSKALNLTENTTHSLIESIDLTSMSVAELDEILLTFGFVMRSDKATKIAVIESQRQLKSLNSRNEELTSENQELKKNTTKRTNKATKYDQNYGLIVAMFEHLLTVELADNIKFDRSIRFRMNAEFVKKFGSLDGTEANKCLLYPTTDLKPSYLTFGQILAMRFGIYVSVESYPSVDGSFDSFNPSTDKDKMEKWCKDRKLPYETEEQKAHAKRTLTLQNQWTITMKFCKSFDDFIGKHARHPAKTIENIESRGGFIHQSKLDRRVDLGLTELIKLAIEQSKTWNIAENADVSDVSDVSDDK